MRAPRALLLLLGAAIAAPALTPTPTPTPSRTSPALTPTPTLLVLRNACASPEDHAMSSAHAHRPLQEILSYEETCGAAWGASVSRAVLRALGAGRAVRVSGGVGAVRCGALEGAARAAGARLRAGACRRAAGRAPALARLARAVHWRSVLLLPAPARCHDAAASAPLALATAGVAVAWHVDDDDTSIRPDAVVAFLCGNDAPTPATVAALEAAAVAGAAPLLLLLPEDELPLDEEPLRTEPPELESAAGNASWVDDGVPLLSNDTTLAEAAWRALGVGRRHVVLAADAGAGGGLALYEARGGEGGGWRRVAPLQALRARAEDGAGREGGGVRVAPLLLLLAPFPLAVTIVLAVLALRWCRRRRRERGSALLAPEQLQWPREEEGDGEGEGEARRVGEGMESMLSCWLQQLHEYGGPPPASPAPAPPAPAPDPRPRYRGEPVQLRPLPPAPALTPAGVGIALELRAAALDVLLVMQALHHENLNPFIGCVSGPRPALAWAWAARGSLEDVLVADAIRLDWPFRLSLLTDLVRGARRLHASPLRVHGRLTSRACLVDARWTLRISDYGLPAFYRAQGLPEPTRTARDLLWTAPELLRVDATGAGEAGGAGGTQAGDVFSFAIIMQEVIVRGEPYCMLPLTPEEIIEKLLSPPPLIRPSVSMSAAPPEAISVMRQCWSEAPDLRPDFNSLLDTFRCLHRGRKVNIVDSMFEMLEKYSTNLEQLIRERTEQLDMEKRKTEQLLNRMLPRQVAERLLLGVPVEPEEFSDVSVYFSDIVGFTALAAQSTPVQVVDLLNELYTRFDALIERHGVYKVETIGDAYMVVGGLPQRCSDHAARVATVALLLLGEAARVRVRHVTPPRPLRLRAGMHTGAVCAGVVGRTMPRYCLFGDTVNVAARMESTGAPCRVQLSAATARRLQAAGGFSLRERGLTHVKGKGPMRTYWLLAKDGLDVRLPTPPPLDEDEAEPDRPDVDGPPTDAAPESSSSEVATPPPKSDSFIWQRAGTQSADSSPTRTASSTDHSAPYARYKCGAGAVRVLRRQWSLEHGEPPPAPAPPATRYKTRADPP